MKNSKRLAAFLLVAALMAGLFAGCGSTEGEPPAVQHGARRPRGAEQQEIVNYRVQRKEAVKVNRLHGQIIHLSLIHICSLWFMPVCAAAIMAATGLLGGLSTGEDPLKLILPALVEACLLYTSQRLSALSQRGQLQLLLHGQLHPLRLRRGHADHDEARHAHKL